MPLKVSAFKYFISPTPVLLAKPPPLVQPLTNKMGVDTPHGGALRATRQWRGWTMLLQGRRWGQGIGEQIIGDNTAYHGEKPVSVGD